jgi:hypothetical protein
MNIDEIKAAACTLERLGGETCLDAAALMRQAERVKDSFQNYSIEEGALCKAIAEMISQAMDHGNYDRTQETAINSLFFEMQGRIFHGQAVRGLVMLRDEGRTVDLNELLKTVDRAT